MTFKNLLLIFALTSFPLSNTFSQNLFEQGKQLFQDAKFQEAYEKLKQDGAEREISDPLFLESKRHELEALIYLGAFNQAEFELVALINQAASKNDLESLNSYIFKSLLAKVKLKKGQFKEGANLCESLIPYFKSIVDQSHLATVYNILGQCLNGNGERGKALDFQKQCLIIREKLYGPKHILLCEPLGGIAYEQIYLEEYAAAKRNYDRAKKIINAYPKDHPVKIYINNGIGVWHRNQGQYQKAIEVLLNAAKYNEELFGPIHYRNGSMYGNIAGLFELSKEDEKSIFYGLKARTIFLENYGPLHPYLARSNRGLGNSFLNQKDYSKAMFHFQHALKAVVHNIDPSQKRVQVKREDLEISHDLLLVLQDMGLAYFTKYEDSKDLLDLKLAEEYYGHTIYCVDLILEGYLEDASKKLLLSDAKNFYERAMHVAFEYYKRTNDNKYLSNAFIIAEKSKSTLLRKSMQTQEAIRFSSIPDSLKQKELQLRKQIGTLNFELQLEKRKEIYADKNIVDNLESEIFKLEEAFAKTLSTFKDNYQDYYKLKYGNQLLSMEEAIKKLGPKQEAINFFWGEDYIFVIHFSDSTKQFLRIPNSELFKKNLKLIVENIANPQWAEEEANKANVKEIFINACSYMYQKLMGKLDIKKDKHLIIIPDGQLFYLPFEVLIDQENYTEQNYGDYNYLLKKHPLRYDFSLNAVLENTGTKHNKKGLIAFAPSYKNSNRNVLNKEMNFYPLKNAEHEVHWLDQVLGAEAHFEENAQETTFKSKKNYSVEHLAMHGFLNEEDDLFSGLVFAKPRD